MNNPTETIPGQERYLYTKAGSMKCCIHPCTVWDCPESVCVEDFPAVNGRWKGRGALKRYQETLKAYKVFKECNDIREAAKILGIDVNNTYRRFRLFQFLITAQE